MKDIEKLSKELEHISKKKIPEYADKMVRAFGMEAMRAVVYATPVDTGVARGNWILSTWVPSPEFDETRRGGAASVNEAWTVIEVMSAGTENFLTNNTSYIVYLNEGSSRQAPRMFVQHAIGEVEERFDTIATAILKKR